METFKQRLTRKNIKPCASMYIVAALPFVLLAYIVLTLWMVAS